MALLDSLFANLGRASDVNDTGQIYDFLHFEHVFVALEVNFVLGFIQNLHVVHDASKYKPIAEQGSFRDPDSVTFKSAVL